MKKLLLLLVMAGFAAGAFAQPGATANSLTSATVVTPISITKDVDLSFGNVAVHSTSGGAVILDTNDGTTTTGDVTLPATAGTVTSAAFTVNGETDYTYAIILPTTATITDAGVETMELSSFTSVPSGTGTLTLGTEALKVGATLTVGAAQVVGAYTGNFDVTVNYN